MTATRLIDTNILVYRFDPRDPIKQRMASDLLRDGLSDGSVVLPHQAIIEFVAATTRTLKSSSAKPLLSQQDALMEAESLLRQFPVLYPDSTTLSMAIRGCSAYQLSWFDAHLWAYAECFGIPEIISEDFQHGRYYGQVRIVNPFKDDTRGIQELPALYEPKV